MSDLVLLSQIALWILMLGIYGAVFLLYRYLGDRVRGVRNEKQTGLSIGEPIAPIKLQTVKGTSVQIGSSTHETQLLFFAAAGCRACEMTAPLLASLAEQYRRSVETLVIFGGSLDKAQEFAASMPEHVSVAADIDSSVAEDWKIRLTPFAIVVRGRDGVVLYEDIAGRDVNLKYAFGVKTIEKAAIGIPIAHHAT